MTLTSPATPTSPHLLYTLGALGAATSVHRLWPLDEVPLVELLTVPLVAIFFSRPLTCTCRPIASASWRDRRVAMANFIFLHHRPKFEFLFCLLFLSNFFVQNFFLNFELVKWPEKCLNGGRSLVFRLKIRKVEGRRRKRVFNTKPHFVCLLSVDARLRRRSHTFASAGKTFSFSFFIMSFFLFDIYFDSPCVVVAVVFPSVGFFFLLFLPFAEGASSPSIHRPACYRTNTCVTSFQMVWWWGGGISFFLLPFWLRHLLPNEVKTRNVD